MKHLDSITIVLSPESYEQIVMLVGVMSRKNRNSYRKAIEKRKPKQIIESSRNRFLSAQKALAELESQRPFGSHPDKP